MPHLDQHVNQPSEPATPGRARLGLVFFFAYLALYAAFVVLNAFWPEAMDTLLPGGVNLAIAYGFGLIAAAFLLAVVYGWLCRNREP